MTISFKLISVCLFLGFWLSAFLLLRPAGLTQALLGHDQLYWPGEQDIGEASPEAAALKSAPALHTYHPEPMSLGSGGKGNIVTGHDQFSVHSLAPE
jgi:hypothetical protein